MAVFDLGTAVPISYEAFLRWSAQGVAAGRGLHLWPTIAFWGLVQVYLGAATAALHLDPRAMRLVLLPFLAAIGWGEFLLARRLGAGRFWAAAVAMLVVCSPLTLALATGFSSDVPYLGLLMLAVATGLGWVQRGRGGPLTVALVLLALVQRQYGLGVLGGVTVGLILARRTRRVAGREWAILLAGWLLALGTLALAYPLGIATPDSRRYAADLLRPPLTGIAAGVFEVPVMTAFLGLPLLLPLLASRGRRVGNRQLVAVALAVYTLLMSAVVFAGFLGPGRARAIFPGDWFTQAGLGPAHMPGGKPTLFSGTGFLLLQGLTLVTMVLIFAWRADAWTVWRRNLVPAAFLLVVAASQFPAIYMDAIIDRHFLPVAALALPVVAVALTRSGYRWQRGLPLLRASVLVAALLEVGFFAVGEQDQQAWLSASQRAAAVELANFEPLEVDAGPLNAELIDIPYYAANGRPPTYPRPVKAFLSFAPPGDARPGFEYRSLAPGKVVIVCVEKRPRCGELLR